MSLDERVRKIDMYSRGIHSRVAPFIARVLRFLVDSGKITEQDAVLVVAFIGATMISSAAAAYSVEDAREADRVIDTVFSWVRKDVGQRLENLNSLDIDSGGAQ